MLLSALYATALSLAGNRQLASGVYKIGVGWDEGKYGSKLPVSNILAGKV
jgi:hypothetical protein